MNLHVLNRRPSARFLMIPLFIFVFSMVTYAKSPLLFPNHQMMEIIKKEATAFKKFKKVEKRVLGDIGRSIAYPELAMNYEIEGTVKVQFYFDGEVSDVKILESVSGGCDEAVLKAIQSFPKLYRQKGGEKIDGANIIMQFKFQLN